jgi:serine/threonine protein kinase
MLQEEKNQTGGKLIGSGTYGCVFDKPLNCKNMTVPSYKKMIGKITSREDAKTELNLSQQLASFPKANQYFVIIDSTCTPEPRTKQSEEDLKSCTLMKGVKLNTTIQLLMPYGGKPLYSIPHQMKSLNYFSICQSLLEAGTILLIKSVVHYDLSMSNILCDSPSTIKIIDFGTGWNPKNIQAYTMNLYHVFNPKVNHIAPEVAVINGIRQNVLLPIILSRIQDEKAILQQIQRLYHILPSVQIQLLKRFIEQSWSFREKDWITYFTLYWSKIDAWAIGSTLLSLYCDFSMDPAFERSNEYETYAKSALKAMKGLCEIDPAKRMDAAEALAIWNPNSAVLQDKEVIQWLEERKKEREEINKIRL